jgi:hypothetical protein
VFTIRVKGLSRRAQRGADGGSSLPGIALIVFIVLKLTGVVGWSWWWVLSPIWISGILFVLRLCALVVALHIEARRHMRAFMDQLKSEDWRRGRLVTGKGHPGASGGSYGSDGCR